MTYHKIASSSIDELAYDRESASLSVRFRAGREYIYTPVPEDEYHRLLAAESVGRHFVRYVRDAGYEYRRVG